MTECVALAKLASPEIVRLRRDFHQHPEISHKEERTSRVIDSRYRIGSLYRQSSVFWAAHIRDLHTGWSFKRSSGCKLKKDALKALKAILGNITDPTLQKIVPTLGDALTKLYQVKEPDLSPSSRNDCQQSYEMFRARFGADTPLTQIDYAEVERYLSDRVKAGQRRTAQKHLMMLRSLMTWAVHRDWLSKNPLDGLKPPRQQTRELAAELRRGSHVPPGMLSGSPEEGCGSWLPDRAPAGDDPDSLRL